MTNKTENPRAFPVANEGFVQNGMTLRDYFAGQALVGMYANPEFDMLSTDGKAEEAFDMADKMLEQR